MSEFVECQVCASKPGSPNLCASCLQNRSTILELQQNGLRDRFAMTALAGMRLYINSGSGADVVARETARAAYVYADAMMEARKR